MEPYEIHFKSAQEYMDYPEGVYEFFIDSKAKWSPLDLLVQENFGNIVQSFYIDYVLVTESRALFCFAFESETIYVHFFFLVVYQVYLNKLLNK